MSRMRFFLGLLLLGLLGGVDPSSVPAQEIGATVVKRGVIAENFYVAGGRVDVRAEVQGDVVAAGGRLSIGRLVTGDVLAAAGDVTVSGEVTDDVRVAGGAVTIDGAIRGDVTAAGGSVDVLPEAKIGGRTFLVGGSVDMRGTSARGVKIAAGRIILAGAVDGNADLTAREIEILSTARIKGDLTYRSARPAKIDAGAEIGGQVVHLPFEPPTRAGQIGRTIIGAGGILLVLGLMAAGTVLVLLFPGFTVSAARTIGSDPMKSLGLGFVLLVSTPVAGITLMITLIGIPLGLTTFALYPVLLLVGFLIAAVFLGDLGARLVRRPELPAGPRVLSLVLALIVLGLLQMIPIAGVLVLFLALLFGLGAWAVQAYRAYATPR